MDDRLVAVAATTVAAATAAATVATATPAATTTATTAAESTSAATASTTTTAAATEATFFARAGFVNGEGAAAVLLPVQGGNRGVCFAIVGHLHEPEALASARVAVVNDLGGKHLPVLAEQLFELGAIHLVAQISDIQLLSHRSISWAWLICGPVLIG